MKNNIINNPYPALDRNKEILNLLINNMDVVNGYGGIKIYQATKEDLIRLIFGITALYDQDETDRINKEWDKQQRGMSDILNILLKPKDKTE